MGGWKGQRERLDLYGRAINAGVSKAQRGRTHTHTYALTHLPVLAPHAVDLADAKSGGHHWEHLQRLDEGWGQSHVMQGLSAWAWPCTQFKSKAVRTKSNTHAYTYLRRPPGLPREGRHLQRPEPRVRRVCHHLPRPVPGARPPLPDARRGCLVDAVCFGWVSAHALWVWISIIIIITPKIVRLLHAWLMTRRTGATGPCYRPQPLPPTPGFAISRPRRPMPPGPGPGAAACAASRRARRGRRWRRRRRRPRWGLWLKGRQACRDRRGFDEWLGQAGGGLPL